MKFQTSILSFHLFLSFILCVNNLSGQNRASILNPNKFFFKAGITKDYDWTPKTGYHFSLGYNRNLWKGLNIGIFYSHSQTKTLKGSNWFDTNLYADPNDTRNYITHFIGISQEELLATGGESNGFSAHDVFGIRAGYDFKIGKQFAITPFAGLAYGTTKYFEIFIDEANFINNKLVSGTTGFRYEQGKVFGPDLGFDLTYTFNNKHHQLFIEPELILLTTPGNPLVTSAYEAVQLGFGYSYRF